jgi:hypothetical protein
MINFLPPIFIDKRIDTVIKAKKGRPIYIFVFFQKKIKRILKEKEDSAQQRHYLLVFYRSAGNRGFICKIEKRTCDMGELLVVAKVNRVKKGCAGGVCDIIGCRKTNTHTKSKP